MMIDDSSQVPELFDQDTCEPAPVTPQSSSRPLAAVGLAIIELDISSRVLAQMVRHVDTTQP
jgi:hypothetical protein